MKCDCCGKEIKKGEKSYINSVALYKFCQSCENWNREMREKTGKSNAIFFRK